MELSNNLLRLFGAMLVGGTTTIAVAAEILPVPERPRGGSLQPEPLPEVPLEPPPAPALTLPPVPSAPKHERLSSQLRVSVKRIQLTGNTVFSDAELSPLITPYEGRAITSEELQNLRNALSLHYLEHGYINSGAVIPDQDVNDGVIEIEIIEGRLTDVALGGNERLRDSYIRQRLMLNSDQPLNLETLQDDIQLLQQNRLINRVNAELEPGLQRGESLLRVLVEERRPYDLGVSFNNQRSPSVGSFQGEVWSTLYNPTGFGDSLYARYGFTEGLDDVDAGYSIPLNVHDTQLQIYVDRSKADIVEEPFDEADIEIKTRTYGISLTHPFYRTPRRQFHGSISFEKRRSETFILGERESLSLGPENGKSDVAVVRLGQEWLDRGLNRVISARSIFSVGLDVLGATKNSGDIPDGQFISWLGQFQWVQRLWDSDTQLLVRSDLQLTPDALLALEQLGIGGAYSVRGYRENLLVRDNGWVTSAELRFPVGKLPLPWFKEGAGDGQVQLAVFFDFGWGWNNKRLNVDSATPDPKRIYSPGIGLRWDPNTHINAQLYWGKALKDVDVGGEHDLQDSGIHFALNVRL